MVRIQFTGAYTVLLQDLVTEHPDLRNHIDQSVAQFRKNPDDTRLCNHSLHKRLSGKYAFSVTDDIRIIYEPVGTNTVRFLAIGEHKTVYR